MFSLLKKVDDVEKINYILTEKYWLFGSIGEKIDNQTTEIDKNIIDFKVCQCYRKDGRIYFKNYNSDVYYLDITEFAQLLVKN